MTDHVFPRLGDRGPITSYARGFTIAGARYDEAVVIVESGVYRWSAPDVSHDAAALIAFLQREAQVDFLILGTGANQHFPAPDVAAAFEAAGMPLEPMATGAACRTYNLLLAEQRRFAAALALA
ncbi:MAG: Mth938-like domain-containing protein [Hyphomicrobiales bacterium]|nr:Mth938-like domain-containing protein [Hyphomicrobiales bacterium]